MDTVNISRINLRIHIGSTTLIHIILFQIIISLLPFKPMSVNREAPRYLLTPLTRSANTGFLVNSTGSQGSLRLLPEST